MTTDKRFPAAGLYYGHVVHRRLAPKYHKLNYRIFSLFVDLDNINELPQNAWMLSVNKFNLVSFYEKDYGDSTGRLKEYVYNEVKSRYPKAEINKIYLLTMPRILGYIFNPLSIYFCYDRNYSLTAVLYEVSNTFGQRHNYVFDIHEPAGRHYRHACFKEFYVSPFLEMDLQYKFSVRAPGDTFALTIQAFKNSNVIMNAIQTMSFTELSAKNLAGLLATIPFMTVKVIAGIHLEALILWLKGVKIVPNISQGVDANRFYRNRER